MERKDAVLTKYDAGGYLLSIPSDGSEYEADTAKEAIHYAHEEGVTRVYSSVRPKQFVILAKEG